MNSATLITIRPDTEAVIEVEASQGVYHLLVRSPDGPCFNVRNIGASIRYETDGQEQIWDLLQDAAVTRGQMPSGHAIQISREHELFRTDLEIHYREATGLFELGIRVQLTQPGAEVKLLSAVLFEADFADTFLAGYGREACRFWRNWHDIWFPTGSMPLTGKEDPAEVNKPLAYHFGALYAPSERTALSFAYQMPNRWIDGIALHESEEIVAENRIGAKLSFKQPLYSDRLMVSLGPELTAALPALHQHHVPRRKVTETRDHFGWNSWEAYQTKVTAADVVENMEAICELPWLQEQIRYIIIDDGWQKDRTQWEANEKFPDGMEAMAAQICDHGFQPGIWTAPFLVAKESELRELHPEWLLDDGDEPLSPNGQTFYLDPTHPEARAYIGGIYQRLYAWGYRYYKTDFLVEACHFFVPGRPEYRETARCHDPELGIMGGMHAAMQTIRAAIGEDSFWLGCGTDIGSGALLMDASRTGGDIAPYWTRVPNQARSVIHHFHLHGNLFLADPDFTLIKGSDTFHPEYLDVPLVAEAPYVVDAWNGGRCFDSDDARTWATLVIQSGGLLNLSDRIRGLNETGLDIIRTALEYAGGNAAIPLDMESPIPGILLREEAEFYLLGLLNWDNEADLCLTVTESMGVPFPTSGVLREVWSGRDIPLADGVLTATLPPHKCLLFQWNK